MFNTLINILKGCLFIQPESTGPIINRYDHLDGYRGYLCLLVLMQHTCNELYLDGDYQVFNNTGNFIGVSGFFALSTFLLTHRLLVEFDKSKSMIDVGAICIKYALKRFCRIYISFVIYCTMIKLGPSFISGGVHWRHASWLSLVTLNR